MKKLIEDLHDNPIFMKIIEMGCGSTLMNTLCEVAGASNTVYWAKAPYSREYIQRAYAIPKTQRIVSKETIERILSSEELTEQVNTIYVSSFQIGPGVSTHGYIGIKNDVGEFIFHISIHEEMKREEYLKLIADIGIKLVGAWIEGSESKIQFDYIDAEWEFGAPAPSVLIDDIHKSNKFSAFLIKKGRWTDGPKRLEELLRTPSKGLIVYKGSFNPLTIAHDELRKKTEKLYPGYDFVYCVSLTTFDKTTTWANLTERIFNLSFKNDVLVTTEPSFSKLIEICGQKAPNKHLVFPMGHDTWVRLFRDHEHNPLDIEKMKATFVVANRNGQSLDAKIKNVRSLKVSDSGISSSMVREMQENGDDVSEYLA